MNLNKISLVLLIALGFAPINGMNLLNSDNEINFEITEQELTPQEKLDHDLLDAAKSGKLGKARKSLLKGANIEFKDGEGYTALHLAAFYEEYNMMIFLIKNGANTNALNRFFEIPRNIISNSLLQEVDPTLILQYLDNHQNELTSLQNNSLEFLKPTSAATRVPQWAYLKLMYNNPVYFGLDKTLACLYKKGVLEDMLRKCTFLYYSQDVQKDLRKKGLNLTFTEYEKMNKLIKNTSFADLMIEFTNN